MTFVVGSARAAIEIEDTTLSQSLFAEPHATQPYVRILTRYNGVYRITGAELARAGLDINKLDPAKLSLWNADKQIPVLVTASAPPRFSETDTIEFVGEVPRGTYSYFMPYNLHNVYQLRWQDPAPMQYATESLPVISDIPPVTFMDHRHHESDLYYQHSTLPPGTTDNFFWCHWRAGQEKMFSVIIDFPGLDKESDLPIRYKVRVFGQSDPVSTSPHHQADVFHGDVNIGRFEFDGKRYHDFYTSMPVTKAEVQKRVAFRTPPGRENAIDWVMLDSIDVSYPRKLDAEGNSLFTFSNDLITSHKPGHIYLAGTEPGTRVFSPSQQKVYLQSAPSTRRITVANDDRNVTYTAVTPDGWYFVDDLVYVEDASHLADVPSDTELLILYSPPLERAADFLRDYRTHQGMNVYAADVRQLYDIVNHGYLDDISLKRYIRYVRSVAPGLKYLLLLGDSTVNHREASTFRTFPPPAMHIPIHWVVNPATTWTGGYPDDNWYGAFGRGNYPDIAVGRIPANDLPEAFSYIRKVVEYEELKLSANDPMLFVSSVEKSFQDLVLDTELDMRDHFSSTTVLFPETRTADQEVSRLRDNLSSGVQLMYYVGHGGSFVWRVGPTDFRQQKDLFTPAEVDKMANKGRYPIVTCSSCYTTSFDNAYSLGEAFIGKADAGAIAIIGTPWKSTVYEDHAFNTQFLKMYVDPQNKTLGEVFLKAKLAMRPRRANADNSVDTQSFTMLGDPCLKLTRKQ